MAAVTISGLGRYPLNIVGWDMLITCDVFKIGQFNVEVREHIGIGRYMAEGYIRPWVLLGDIGIKADLKLHTAGYTGTAGGTHMTAGTVIDWKRMAYLTAHGIRLMHSMGLNV